MKLQKEKKFQFRWIERKPERLDAVKNAQEVRRWLPVNSTQPVAGAFDRHIDGSTGAVHLLDQILVWKPYWLFEKEQALEVRLAGGLNDISAKDGQEKNDLRLAASKRKASESRTRIEVSGDDIQYTGEVEATGGEYEAGSESDMAVNE